jgi:RNA-binding protein YhbY
LLEKPKRNTGLIGEQGLRSGILQAINNRLRNDEIVLEKEN